MVCYMAVLNAVKKLHRRLLTKIAIDTIGNFLLEYELSSCRVEHLSTCKYICVNFEAVNC